jgi:hypothetical protein
MSQLTYWDICFSKRGFNTHSTRIEILFCSKNAQYKSLAIACSVNLFTQKTFLSEHLDTYYNLLKAQSTAIALNAIVL